MNGYNEVYLENYEAVAAYTVMPMAEGASGDSGSYFQGIIIYWTTESEPGGVTNSGWYTGNENSPFFNVSAEEILNHIKNYGDLKTYFDAWMQSGKNQKEFISKLPLGCWNIVTTP